jgi:Tetratricopeptide repeat
MYSTRIHSDSQSFTPGREKILQKLKRSPVGVKGGNLNPFICRFLLLFYLFSILHPTSAEGGGSASVLGSAQDQVQDCLRELWSKPVFWDRNAIAPVDPSVCKAEPAKMEQALKEQHLVAFRLSNAVLIVQEGSFDKNRANSYYRWKTPEIILRVVPTDRNNAGSRPPSETELHEVGDAILKKSHLPPLDCPYVASEGEIGRMALSIFVEIHRLHINSEGESVVARVVASDPEPDRTTGEGRIVYGELQGGHFQYQWESPLLGGSSLSPAFRNLLHNGHRQITVLSQIGISKPEHDSIYAFFAFDLDGTEISRQPPPCEFYDYDLLAKHSATACPLVDSDEKTHNVIRDGRYVQVQGREAPGQAAAEGGRLNEEGMQLMKAGNYAEAAEKFIDALEKKPDSGLFANNAGFACYKVGRYEEALSYVKASIDLNQNRPVAYLNFGDILVKLNRNAEAREAYTEYLATGPSASATADVKKKLDVLPPSP